MFNLRIKTIFLLINFLMLFSFVSCEHFEVEFDTQINPTVQTHKSISRPTTLLTNDGENEEPAWSPDGKKIAFVSNRDGNNQIYVMDVE